MNWSISHRSSFRGGEDGFTLIEILVAISILAIVLTSVYGIFTSVSNTRERLDADSAEYHKARVVFDRLGRELRGAYFQPLNSDLVFTGNSADDESLELELTTTAFTPISQMESGIVRVRYQLGVDQDNDGSGLVLMRSEQPAYEKDTTADMMRFVPGINAMQIRFFSNGQWQTDWDSRVSGMPELVEITLQLRTKDERLVSFVSAFDVPRVEPR